jgi:hypothetical protein
MGFYQTVTSYLVEMSSSTRKYQIVERDWDEWIGWDDLPGKAQLKEFKFSR